MKYFGRFYLDLEKDVIVTLYQESERLFYELKTPNHKTGNLIRNFAKVCELPLSYPEEGLPFIQGEIPCYIDGENRVVYIFHLGRTKAANIYPDGRIEVKATIPAIAKTLMSQTKEYHLDITHTLFKTYIPKDCKFRTDLHTHMNGNLNPDILIALGIMHQIRYPLYYVKKLHLKLSSELTQKVMGERALVHEKYEQEGLCGKQLERTTDDNTYVNFAQMILQNLEEAVDNIRAIRSSLVVLKDGQAVFTNLEKVYVYRYVFCKGTECKEKIELQGLEDIPDEDVRRFCIRMRKDRQNPLYTGNTIFQDKLLWIARQYASQGIFYAEIADTTLLKKYESIRMLEQVHAIMPAVASETGVMLRFLAAFRRIPLSGTDEAPEQNWKRNLEVLRGVVYDPYVAGCDFVGEEINDIIELKPLFPALLKIAKEDPDFVIRIHAGENDSLLDNMAHSIACVKDSLEPGQPMPKMRLGHGLYTYVLSSAKGQCLLKDLKENHIILEFQLTSNVRLNNWNSFEKHPLREYLRNGIPCIQGTDGAALYGTNNMEEQLALERILGLREEELKAMKETETKVMEESMHAFARKKQELNRRLVGKEYCSFLFSCMERPDPEYMAFHTVHRLSSKTELKDRIAPLPQEGIPVIVAGGSFNSEGRYTRMHPEEQEQLSLLLDCLDPKKAFFVIGHKVTAYERYIVEHNHGRFAIYAFVPSLLSIAERERLKKAGVWIRVSPESEGMGIYKSFNYEIFERRRSLVIALDGNSSGANLIQEARNGKGRATIFVSSKAHHLMKKAESLEGYVSFFNDIYPLIELVKKYTDLVKDENNSIMVSEA